MGNVGKSTDISSSGGNFARGPRRAGVDDSSLVDRDGFVDGFDFEVDGMYGANVADVDADVDVDVAVDVGVCCFTGFDDFDELGAIIPEKPKGEKQNFDYNRFAVSVARQAKGIY